MKSTPVQLNDLNEKGKKEFLQIQNLVDVIISKRSVGFDAHICPETAVQCHHGFRTGHFLWSIGLLVRQPFGQSAVWPCLLPHPSTNIILSNIQSGMTYFISKLNFK